MSQVASTCWLRAPRGLRACHCAGAGAGTMMLKLTLVSGAGVLVLVVAHTLSQQRPPPLSGGRRAPEHRSTSPGPCIY
jgi:hypothetical protein